jgi:hypothetical protein
MATPAPPSPDYCALLAAAQQQMGLLMSGQAVAAIETPLLGRVEYNQTNRGSLQMYIEQLRALCAAQNGQYCYGPRRRPISFEACP